MQQQLEATKAAKETRNNASQKSTRAENHGKLEAMKKPQWCEQIVHTQARARWEVFLYGFPPYSFKEACYFSGAV